MSKPRVQLTVEQAESVLPNTPTVHTFVQGGFNVVIGADWDRKDLLDAIRKGRAEVAGTHARAMGHGLAVFTVNGVVFAECDDEKLGALESPLSPVASHPPCGSGTVAEHAEPKS